MSKTERIVAPASKADIGIVIDLLNMVYPISLALRQEIYTNMVAFSYKKGDVLVEENSICNYMYFIKKGALMGCTTHNKKKIVTYITVENEFVSSISGLYGRSVSKEEISAVEDVELIAIHNDVLQRMFKKHFDLNFLFRVMVEQYYMDAQERAHIVRVGSAKERYLHFAKSRPDFIERLPLEYVASLLDMKPLTFIKIQKQQQLLIQKDKETEKWYQVIENHIEANQSFRKQNIKLGTFAEELAITSSKLSSILNNYYQLTFVDFINTYRIRYIKNQMTKPEIINNFTIEALAYNAGFSSRSAFYNSFKKVVGVNPIEYVQSLKS